MIMICLSVLNENEVQGVLSRYWLASEIVRLIGENCPEVRPSVGYSYAYGKSDYSPGSKWGAKFQFTITTINTKMVLPVV